MKVVTDEQPIGIFRYSEQIRSIENADTVEEFSQVPEEDAGSQGSEFRRPLAV